MYITLFPRDVSSIHFQFEKEIRITQKWLTELSSTSWPLASNLWRVIVTPLFPNWQLLSWSCTRCWSLWVYGGLWYDVTVSLMIRIGNAGGNFDLFHPHDSQEWWADPIFALLNASTWVNSQVLELTLNIPQILALTST